VREIFHLIDKVSPEEMRNQRRRKEKSPSKRYLLTLPSRKKVREGRKGCIRVRSGGQRDTIRIKIRFGSNKGMHSQSRENFISTCVI